MSTQATGRASTREKTMVNNHSDAVLAFPEGEFYRSDVAAYLQTKLRQFEETSIAVVRREEKGDDNKFRNVYAIDDDARGMAREQVANRDAICPCDHAGVENHGTFYTCGFALCPNTYARADLEVRH